MSGASLAGQVVVVTGGTRGIGQAVVHAFLADGATVIATGTSADDVARRNADKSCPAALRYDAVDLGDESSTAGFAARLRSLPRVDALINNAGINQIVPLARIEDAAFDRLLRIDLQAPLFLAQAVATGMQARKYGRIVNVASVWSVLTKPGRAMYSAAKTGLAGLTRTMAAEWGADEVLANAISPGFTRTELTASTNTPEAAPANCSGAM
jgi:3-oxoacyl-[acyl-carrier protein] reductase